MEFKNKLPRDILITGSANGGFVLNCGCCTCTFTDPKEMANAILDYINDPEGMEKKYHESIRNRYVHEQAGFQETRACAMESGAVAMTAAQGRRI